MNQIQSSQLVLKYFCSDTKYTGSRSVATPLARGPPPSVTMVRGLIEPGWGEVS